jgi:hypothetical protein
MVGASSDAVPSPTAQNAKPLPQAERQKRLAALVADGKITERQASLIDLREPTAREREIAEQLAGKRAV